MWLLAMFAASVATASLIGIGFIATNPTPALSPAIAANSANNGAPLFTGSIPIEPVEVTTSTLRGSLYSSDRVQPVSLTYASPDILTAVATPFPVRPLRRHANKPTVIETAPVRLVSLSPTPPAALLSQELTPLEPRTQTHLFIVAPGDTLGALLDRYGIDENDQKALINALRTVFAPRRLRAGREVTLTVNENAGDRVVPLTLGFETDFGEILVQRSAKGGYAALVDGSPAGTPKHHRAISRIDTSLYGAARAQKVPDGIIVRMMNTHSYDVDFQREIHQGDSFEVFYSNKAASIEAPSRRGTLLFSSLTTAGKKRSYYRFTTQDGQTDYYNHKGVSSKKPLMRTPIDGARISSGFGMRRDPIKGYNRLHRGTDFAATSGTPILAAGDGRIDFVGRNGGYGRYVRIAHHNGVKTAYAHMKRWAKGLKKGKHVRQGQIIGFVGSTGRSTGPHLHYEVIINGKKTNPLKVKIAGSGRRLKGRELAAFEAEKARVNALRKQAPTTTLVAAS